MRPSSPQRLRAVLRVRTIVVAVVVALAVTGCTPTGAEPTPTATAGAPPTASPTPTTTGTPVPAPEAEVTAALIVVTASTFSVFGTDGTTMLAVDYTANGDAVAAQVAEVVEAEPTTEAIPEYGSPCPAATAYDFGGLVIRSPGSLPTTGSGAYEVIVSAGRTAGGVPIETIAGQAVGAERSAFVAAVRDVVVLADDPSFVSIGFDVVNPGAGPYEQDGAVGDFTGGTLREFAVPHRLGFIGSCA